MNLGIAALLGLVEGLTEYLPVSSTGHLVLVSHLLGEASEAAKSFDVVIQLGAILAVVVHFRVLIATHLRGLMERSPASMKLALAIVAGFVPTAVVGLLLRKTIKAHLMGPMPIAFALIAGGVLMLAVEAWRKRRGEAAFRTGLEHIGPREGLLIGLGQTVSMWPGSSRSMCTIVTAQLLGFSPTTAAEFSFLLGLPTLGAATLYELLKARDELLSPGMAPALLVGMVVSFLVAWAVVAGFLRWLQKHGLAPFAAYRIALGIAVFALLGG